MTALVSCWVQMSRAGGKCPSGHVDHQQNATRAGPADVVS